LRILVADTPTITIVINSMLRHLVEASIRLTHNTLTMSIITTMETDEAMVMRLLTVNIRT
jgi:hypothetical protein